MRKKAKGDQRVGYQYMPRGAEHCTICSMFREPNTCTAVEGTIADCGWCKLFEPSGLAKVQK